VRRPTKRAASGCARRCRRCAPSGCARTRCSCREIFLRHTDLVEPLSLDEAYLDVTAPKSGLNSATAVAKSIRAAIAQETALTASAGVAPNKFLAKIASDWRKPDGLFVVRPHEAEAFLAPLPVAKIPGVGKVMDARLAALGVRTCADLRLRDVRELERQFGRYGRRLHELARGIDERPVDPDQVVQSISTEDTFERDLPLSAIETTVHALAAKTWVASRRTERIGRTVVLKLKTADFHILTRSHTPALPPQSENEFVEIAASLIARVELPATTLYRLAGVGLSNFRDADEFTQPELFGTVT
jgi:DNA polymerase-4